MVSERLRRSTVGITLDICPHVNPTVQTDAADRVAALILGSGSRPGEAGSEGPTAAVTGR